MRIMSGALVLALCMSLVVGHAGAADYTVDIFGNANMDDTIDEDDIAYLERIIDGTDETTELADANYDGEIDENDITQIEQIIVGEEKEITFIDARGEAVTVKKPIERIVVLHLAPASVIRVLGAEGEVVGTGGMDEKYYSSMYPVMSKLPAVGGESPNYEEILDLKPDIVLQQGTSTEELEEKFDSWTTVVRFDFFSNPQNMAKMIMELGYILDKEDKAKEFIEFQSSVLNTIKARTEGLSEEERPRVFYCSFPSAGYRYYAICPKEYAGPVLDLAGGNNIAADLIGAPGIVVNPEWVLEQNPDIIFARELTRLPMGYNTDNITGVKMALEQMVNEPGWDHINAVKDGKVYIEVSEIDYGMQSFIMVAYMAKLIYPDLFEDFDPETIQQEFLTRFQRVDYDLDEHGTFVYPPIIKDEGKLSGIPDRYYDSIAAQYGP
jgi:iron complex transport system substrate-binding protein